jgi:amino acid transporter
MENVPSIHRATQTLAHEGLRHGTMTLPHVLVQAVASVGPALTVFVTFQPMVALAGIDAPLIQILDLFVVLMMASTLVQLARLFPSAGGYYTYVSETLGAGAGFAVSWIYFLYSATSPGVLLAYLGRFLQINLASAGIHVHWSVFFLIFCAVVGMTVYRGIEFSTKSMLAIATVELAIVLALGFWGFLPAAHVPLSFAVFDPHHLPSGMFGMAAMFGIFTYMGWESAAPLAEETRNPRRSIPIAVILSIVLYCGLKTVCAWGMIMAWGVDDPEGLANSVTMPAIVLAQKAWGGWWYLVLLAIANSIIGVAIAFSIVSSRMWFAMGRAGALPRPFARVHPSYKTPTVATFAQIAFFIVSGLGGAAWVGIDAIYLAGGLTTVFAAIFIYVLANVGLMKHMLTRDRPAFRVVQHAVFPLVSTVVLLIILYRSIVPLPTFPMLYGPIVVAVWMAVGLCLFIALRLTGRRRWLDRAGAASAP